MNTHHIAVIKAAWRRIKRPSPATLIKIRATVLVLVMSASVAIGAPYGSNIPLPTNVRSDWKAVSRQYTIDYDSFFGSHWSLKGRMQNNSDGSHTDTISGTCSAPNGTYTQANFTWLSDAWYSSNGSHGWVACSVFTLTVNGGKVSGTATYQP